MVTKPIIHLNGSGVENLLEPLKAVISKLHEAETLLCQCAPHMRDYYVSPDPSLFTKAQTEYFQRLRKLEEMREELTEIAVDLLGQTGR